MHRDALHAEQIMCQMSTSCHHRASFFVTKPHRATCFCGKQNDTSAEQQALTAKAYGTMNTPGLPWSKTLSIYEARDNHCWNMPTKWSLTVWWPSKQGCAISLSLFPSLESHCWRKFAHILKSASHWDLHASEQTGTMETFAGVERQGEQISLFYTETASLPAH